MSEKREQIIRSATEMIRHGGYNSFSFREIADKVGVKSSSVHHYFPKKENLAAIVAERYSEGFFAALGDPRDLKLAPREVILHYASVFLEAYKGSGKACLCGILSHESPAVPAPVNAMVESFVNQNVDWLVAAFQNSATAFESESAMVDFARLTYTSLTGAMAAATLKRDASWIKSVRDRLVVLF